MASEDVFLNIYDLCSNAILSRIGIGVYHSGVQLYGTEYSFWGYFLGFSGIFESKHCDVISIYMLKLRKSIRIGVTEFNNKEVRDIIKDMGNQYKGDAYNMLTNNCHHFSDALLNLLCNKSLPLWINRISRIGTRVPCLKTKWFRIEKFMPSEDRRLKEEFERQLSSSKTNEITCKFDELMMIYSKESNTIKMIDLLNT